MKQKPVREVVAANLQQLIGYDPTTGRSKVGQCFLVKKGVAQATIGRLIRAEVDAKIDTIAVIAEHFNLRPWMMLAPDLGSGMQLLKKLESLAAELGIKDSAPN